jgi:transposase
MEVKPRRKYTKEFREDVINMLKTGDKTVSALARELGIAEGIIYRWNKKSKFNESKEPEKRTDQDKEIRELRAKLADVTEERDILKKAVSIFSKQGNSK